MDLSKALVITTDCAGSIGLKENDQVKVDYETLSYFTLRNAVFENLSKHGCIEAISYANFCGDEHLDSIKKGMDRVLKDLNQDIIYTGSTESNFSMKESAFSVTVIGRKQVIEERQYNNYAVVGLPLVGEEVLNNKDMVVSLEEVLKLLESSTVSRVIPIGSKGINDRANTVLNIQFQSNEIDLRKSAGPSTCVLIEYDRIEEVKQLINTKITLLKRG